MPTLRKILLTALATVVLAAGGGVWWLYHALDSVVASAIRSYGPQITGVAVKLKAVKIQASDGAAALHGLELGNPKGFTTPRALAVGVVSIKMDVSTITQDVVWIKEVVIERPEITYEHASGGSNLDVIQRQVEAYVVQNLGAKKMDPKTAPAEKKFIIENFYIKGAKAYVSAVALKGNVVTVAVPDLYLIDIGKKSGGVTASQATRQVMSAMTNNVTKSVSFLKLDTVVGSVKKGAAAVGSKVKGWFK